jgi:hypothetical protein
VKLPGEKSEVVVQYLDFCYGKGLPTDTTQGDSHCGAVHTVLTELYALGERLLDCKIRNEILREIVAFTATPSPDICYFPSSRAINNIYNSTTTTSPARRLFVDIYVSRGYGKCFESEHCLPEYHPAFLLDVAKALMVRVQQSSLSLPWRGQPAKADSYVCI